VIYEYWHDEYLQHWARQSGGAEGEGASATEFPVSVSMGTALNRTATRNVENPTPKSCIV